MKTVNKSTTTMITLFLMIAITTSLVALPSANAQASKPTYAYIGVNPNPVGVGQEVLIHAGITDAVGFVIGEGWEGLTVTVTDPSGDTDELGPYKSDSTGGTGDSFTPDMEGEYTFQTHFPEQDYGGVTYLESDSDVVTLIVQAELIAYYPDIPLPTEYWSRPIDSQYRSWYTISGNWLAGKAAGSVTEVVPYNEYAPETAHILWAKPFTSGGLVGGDTGIHGYTTGDAYQGEFAGSVIINGVLYYNRFNTQVFPGFVSAMPQQGIVALDLRTGEEVWFRNNTRLSFGQTLYFDSYNQHGGYAYLWEVIGSTYNAYDAFTGEWVYTMTGVPSGTRIFGPHGEILIYTLDQANGWMTLWNSTILGSSGLAAYAGTGSWGPEGKTYDASSMGIQWNVSIPTGLPGGVRKVFYDNRIIGSTAGTGIGAAMGESPVVLWGIDISSENEGDLLFNETWNPPSDYLTVKIGAFDADLGVFTLWIKETRVHYGFDMDTGDRLWGPTDSQPYQDSYLWGDWHFTTAYGVYYSAATSGIVYAYDLETGDLLWTYEATDPYTEALWMPQWGLYTAFITDGKIYLYHTEHSVVDPKPRGAPFICLNATSGEEIFKIDGLRGTYWGCTAIIADSIIAFHNTYDQRIYAIGKGPSDTSILIMDDVVTLGDSVMVKGMVTDISAGTEDYDLAARFPDGVPAVSDANMSEWMKYVYMQNPTPIDVLGVEVTVSVLDPNGNVYDVGTATTNDGFYKLSFTPPVPGEYTVYATFAGSESYWSSSAVTAINVEEAPVATAEPTPTPAPMTDTYVAGFGIAMLVAIIAIGLVLILMLRKR